MKGLSEIISANAERKSYGIRDKDSILYEDTNPDALWYWELFNTTFLPLNLQKSVLSQRQTRYFLGSKTKSLERLIQAIDKATSLEKDLPKILEEYERYNKAVRKESQLT